jgi:hypothetical protein
MRQRLAGCQPKLLPPFRRRALPHALPIPFRHASGGCSTLPARLSSRAILSPPPARQTDHGWPWPPPEPFPNRWQMQVMAWFAVAGDCQPAGLAVCAAHRAPAGRLCRGRRNAGARSGRHHPAAFRPAEIGRAAYAFNQMRNRLRAFVDDRTAMVGRSATICARRSRACVSASKTCPTDQREGILKEVTEMEAMIAR